MRGSSAYRSPASTARSAYSSGAICPSTPELLSTPEPHGSATVRPLSDPVAAGSLATLRRGRGSRPPQQEGWSALPSSLTPPKSTPSR